MDTRRWQVIEAMFHELAELPDGPAREAALVLRCAGDAALASDVRALLANDAALEAGGPPLDPHLGLRLGAYEVFRLIARGGMAAVYEARRADAQFQQRVAIKIMDLRLSDPALLAQFRAERQILAALEHPSVTRLLDGGMTPLGEPYLVMEYVEGEPIDRYCDARRLDVAARLELFAAVCDGVAFAHRNLVLHRDLKPSNIMVTAEGRARVVDFGTATLLQPDRLATTSQAPLTPAYASPEQLTGAPVGTASDQYSLGLVLFELLTGAPAFGGRTSLLAAVERALAATTSTAPQDALTDAAAAARQTSLPRLRRTLSGDLATILGKALAHDPAARYASVQHLADDLQRWRAGEPILGRPPTLVYQVACFVRRHRVPSAIAATLAAALLVATGVSIDQAARAGRQARIAEAESGKARQLNRFLTQMLSSANPSWYNANAATAGSVTVRQVLDGAGELIERELGTTPAVEAEMRRTLGRTYIGVGAPAQAVPHLERALALFTAQGDEAGIAFSELLLGEIQLQRGEFAAAERRLRGALTRLRALGPQADPEVQFIALNDLGIAVGYQRPGHDEGIALLREAIALSDRHGINQGGAGIAVANLGAELSKAGRIDEAEAAFHDGLRRMLALPTPPPEIQGLRNNLSNVMRVRGRHDEAVRYARDAVEGAARAWPPDHPYQAPIRLTLGRALVEAGHAGEGRDALLEAQGLLQRLRPAGHRDHAGPLVGLGGAYRRLGQLDESQRVLEEARALVAADPALRERAADIAGELGLTLRARGESAAAAARLAESHALYLAAFGPAHPLTGRAQARLGGASE